MIFLTLNKPLREASVENVFRECNISQFRRIGKVDEVTPFTDVSLLNETRTFYYKSSNKLFSYNMDTKENAEIDVGRRMWFCASLSTVYLVSHAQLSESMSSI